MVSGNNNRGGLNVGFTGISIKAKTKLDFGVLLEEVALMVNRVSQSSYFSEGP
jgi:hypothetical protein